MYNYLSKFHSLITLDDVGPSLNSWYVSLHWAKRKKQADLWHEKVRLQARGSRIKISGPVFLHVNLEMGKKRQVFDASNCAVMVKLVEDGLVQAGVLKGDGPEFVAGVVMTARRSLDGQSRTRVTFLPVGA